MFTYRVDRSCDVRRLTAKRHGVTTVYLLRSAMYQFYNCGVLCTHACRDRLALNQLYPGIAEGNMAKKAKKAKKKTGRRKKSAFADTRYLC